MLKSVLAQDLIARIATLGVLCDRKSQPLRVTATNAFASRWLVPRLSRWRTEHADVPLEVIGTDTVLDLEAGMRKSPSGISMRVHEAELVHHPSNAWPSRECRMKFGPVVLFLLLGLLTQTNAAHATPFIAADANIGFLGPACNCTFNDVAPSIHSSGTDKPVFVQLGYLGWSAEASSYFGILGASSSVVVEGVPEMTDHTNEALAAAGWEDTFVVTGGSGTGILQMQVGLHGVLSGVQGWPGTNPSAFAMYDPLNSNAGISVHLQSDGTVDQVLLFRELFTFGQPFTIHASLSVVAAAYSGFSTTDFSSTARVLDAVVLDSSNGTPVNALIETGSGVDYNDIPSSIGAVPEPESWAMLVTGLASFGLRRRHRRRGVRRSQ